MTHDRVPRFLSLRGGVNAVRLPFTALILLGAVGASCGGENEGPASRQGAQFDQSPCGVLWSVQYRTEDRIRARLPAALSLDFYPLMPDGRISAPTNSSCNVEIAARLQAQCEPCNLNPTRCEPAIRSIFEFPPASCSLCGDEVCSPGEDSENCSRDCLARCGDGLCSAVESALGCPQDCADPCGDGFCSSQETPTDCPEDCQFTVGDGACDPGENLDNSPEDCLSASCGDAWCQPWESALRCPEDCCGAAQCAAGSTFCNNSRDLAECVVAGFNNCPEVVETTTCELGCVGPAAGTAARCRACTDVFLETRQGDSRICSPEEPASCGNGSVSVISCAPIPSAPTCYATVETPCGAGTICSDGQCVACAPNSCTPGARRCGPSGNPETCVFGIDCTFWSTDRVCPAGTGCQTDGVNYNCGACCQPSDTRTCDGGTSLRQCVGEAGARCGTDEVVETCDAGTRCDVVPGAEPICQACCTPGEIRCESLDSHSIQFICVDNPDGCATFVQSAFCEGGLQCNPSSSEPACVPGE